MWLGPIALIISAIIAQSAYATSLAIQVPSGQDIEREMSEIILSESIENQDQKIHNSFANFTMNEWNNFFVQHNITTSVSQQQFSEAFNTLIGEVQ